MKGVADFHLLGPIGVEIAAVRRILGLHGPDRVRIVRIVAAQLGQPPADLLARAIEQDRPPDADQIAKPQDAELHVLAVDLCAVGAFQVGDDDLSRSS